MSKVLKHNLFNVGEAAVVAALACYFGTGVWLVVFVVLLVMWVLSLISTMFFRKTVTVQNKDGSEITVTQSHFKSWLIGFLCWLAGYISIGLVCLVLRGGF